MKTIATIVATIAIVFSGLIAAPAGAATESDGTGELPPSVTPEMCLTALVALPAMSDRLAVLTATVDTMRSDLAFNASAAAATYAREQAATDRADRLYVRTIRLQQQVDRLRARLQAARH